MSIQLAVIGAGPRGVGFLERLAANLPEIANGLPLVVHLVDPHPPGAGRIWRSAQSPLLKLNSMARDVTMFTDVSSTVDGPVWEGPSLIEWAAQVRTGQIDVRVDDPLVAHELEHLAGDSFPTRRLQSEYLAWFYRRAIAALPATVVEYAASATTVTDAPDGTQLVALDNGVVVAADIVLYALGHSGSTPEPEHAELLDFAERHGLHYVAPDFTADADLSAIRAGEPVIVRGMGLAAVDLTVLLTEGRGGRFIPSASLPGQLDYLPSGEEPLLLLGSRRGVPYHSKISSALAAPRAEPRFFNARIAAALEASSETLSFTRDVWPLIAAELQWGYYHELFVGHPDRVRVPWERFVPFLERYRWNSPQLHAAIAAAVPNPVDRLDLEALDRPHAELQDTLRYYIGLDLHARSAPEHSATLGLFTSLLYALFDLGSIIESPKWTARSRAHDLAVWWPNYFSFIASGPPAHRLDELLALSRAGVVEFLGADIAVRAAVSGDAEDAGAGRAGDVGHASSVGRVGRVGHAGRAGDASHAGRAGHGGHFAASSPSAPGEVTARVLVDARLPDAHVRRSDNAALRSLIETGAGCEELVSDADFSGSTGRLLVRPSDSRLIRADGDPHPGAFAIGPYTNAPFAGAFARPGTNAVAFRENDRVARAVLALAVERAAAPAQSPALAESAERG